MCTLSDAAGWSALSFCCCCCCCWPDREEICACRSALPLSRAASCSSSSASRPAERSRRPTTPSAPSRARLRPSSACTSASLAAFSSPCSLATSPLAFSSSSPPAAAAGAAETASAAEARASAAFLPSSASATFCLSPSACARRLYTSSMTLSSASLPSAFATMRSSLALSARASAFLWPSSALASFLVRASCSSVAAFSCPFQNSSSFLCFSSVTPPPWGAAGGARSSAMPSPVQPMTRSLRSEPLALRRSASILALAAGMSSLNRATEATTLPLWAWRTRTSCASTPEARATAPRRPSAPFICRHMSKSSSRVRVTRVRASRMSSGISAPSSGGGGAAAATGAGAGAGALGGGGAASRRGSRRGSLAKPPPPKGSLKGSALGGGADPGT
mmetsp:Transcript_31169/g.79011  ORF Transcript_31169/g.79011 Transcript_31169/m.79011 type:complete len:391 (+) Transcript_31169:726-1898(+)